MTDLFFCQISDGEYFLNSFKDVKLFEPKQGWRNTFISRCQKYRFDGINLPFDYIYWEGNLAFGELVCCKLRDKKKEIKVYIKVEFAKF